MVYIYVSIDIIHLVHYDVCVRACVHACVCSVLCAYSISLCLCVCCYNGWKTFNVYVHLAYSVGMERGDQAVFGSEQNRSFDN